MPAGYPTRCMTCAQRIAPTGSASAHRGGSDPRRRTFGRLGARLCALRFGQPGTERKSMWIAIVILLVVWAILAIAGFVFQGLLWLDVVGIILFLGTLIVGIMRQRKRQHA